VLGKGNILIVSKVVPGSIRAYTIVLSMVWVSGRIDVCF
jgi:hypothetical protein